MLSTRFSSVGAVLSDMQRMSEEFDRALRMASGTPRRFAAEFPPVNMWECDASIDIESELPGFTRDDLDVTVEGSTLTIAGERRLPEVGEGHWRRRERGYGRFRRSIPLPRSADANRVQAKFTDGLLQIQIAKRENARPKRIEVAGH